MYICLGDVTNSNTIIYLTYFAVFLQAIRIINNLILNTFTHYIMKVYVIICLQLNVYGDKNKNIYL